MSDVSLIASIIEAVLPHSGRLEVWRAPPGLFKVGSGQELQHVAQTLTGARRQQGHVRSSRCSSVHVKLSHSVGLTTRAHCKRAVSGLSVMET